jgi:hypothetical protein
MKIRSTNQYSIPVVAKREKNDFFRSKQMIGKLFRTCLRGRWISCVITTYSMILFPSFSITVCLYLINREELSCSYQKNSFSRLHFSLKAIRKLTSLQPRIENGN